MANLRFNPAAVREVRTAAGLTQGQLAEHLGTGQSRVAAWEAGLNAPAARQIGQLWMIARRLGLSVTWWTEERDEGRAPKKAKAKQPKPQPKSKPQSQPQPKPQPQPQPQPIYYQQPQPPYYQPPQPQQRPKRPQPPQFKKQKKTKPQVQPLQYNITESLAALPPAPQLPPQPSPQPSLQPARVPEPKPEPKYIRLKDGEIPNAYCNPSTGRHHAVAYVAQGPRGGKGFYYREVDLALGEHVKEDTLIENIQERSDLWEKIGTNEPKLFVFREKDQPGKYLVLSISRVTYGAWWSAERGLPSHKRMQKAHDEGELTRIEDIEDYGLLPWWGDESEEAFIEDDDNLDDLEDLEEDDDEDDED